MSKPTLIERARAMLRGETKSAAVDLEKAVHEQTERRAETSRHDLAENVRHVASPA